jgi:hypothetical protein
LVLALVLAPTGLAGAFEEPRPPVTTAVSASGGTPARHPRQGTLFKRRWGVELISVQLVSAGYMLEFRYRVLDAAKAKPLFERQTHPVMIDEATGTQLIVPAPAKVGPLRSSDPPQAGRVYWMFFANPGKLVKPGNRVSIVIGDFRASGLVVN